MAIKGSATIELINADGSKEVIKHDNMITNAVSDLCSSYRGEIATILKVASYGDEYAKLLFGGILLFNDTLDPDPDNYCIPSLKITGYASQDAYAGLDVARGSVNAIETGVQSDGSYRLVWDFSTSQANGTIKSIGLCPNMMGQIGASDRIVASEAKDFSMKILTTNPFSGDMLKDSVDGISGYNFNIVAIFGDIAYAIESNNINCGSGSGYICNNGGILKLYTFKLGLNPTSISDMVSKAKYIGCIDIQLPEEFISVLNSSDSNYYALSYSFDFDTGVLVLFPCTTKSDITSNGTTKYVEIEVKNNMNVSLHTFTNNTPGTIYTSVRYSPKTHNSGMYYNFYVGKNYIVACSWVDSKKRLYVINRNDSTDVKAVKYESDSYPTWSTGSAIFTPAFTFGNMLVFRMGSSANTTYEFFVLDLTTGIVKKTNASKMSVWNNLDIGKKFIFAGTGSNLQYFPTINPFILTTKNNLDSPVVKTASQTMKITYTLSEVE